MMRTTPLRISANLSSSARVVTRQPVLRPTPCLKQIQPIRFRTYATESTPPPAGNNSGAASNGPMWIVLGTILAVGGAGYWYTKPIRDVAAQAHGALNTVKDTASSVSDNSGLMVEAAKSLLPPGVFAVYQALQSRPGGIGGLLSDLKDQDLNGVLDQLKKAGNSDVTRVVEKVQVKLKDAKGKAADVDWKSLAEELKGELGPKAQQAIDMLIGKMPSQEDIKGLMEKVKAIGEEQLKQVESSANKVLKEVEKAKKDGKAGTDAFLKGLKEAAPADVDQLIEQIKDAAKKAGLPADTIESYLKSKSSEGKADVEATVKQLTEKLRTASKFIPGNPQDLVAQVKEVSPSLANLLALALENSGITDKDGSKKK